MIYKKGPEVRRTKKFQVVFVFERTEVPTDPIFNFDVFYFDSGFHTLIFTELDSTNDCPTENPFQIFVKSLFSNPSQCIIFPS